MEVSWKYINYVGSKFFTHWIGCLCLALESALKNNNDKLLRQIYRDLSTKTQSCAFLSDRELLAQIGKTLHRDFGAETNIPLYAKPGKKPCIALKWVHWIIKFNFLIDLFARFTSLPWNRKIFKFGRFLLNIRNEYI